MDLRGSYRDRRWLADYRRVDYRYLEYRPPGNYFTAVRHPLPSLFFVAILIGIYEAGIAWLPAPANGSLRAGVELWIRDWLAQAGPIPLFVIPIAAIGLIAFWALWRWTDRPERPVLTIIGIVAEGIALGFGLWAICVKAPYLMEQSGLTFAAINVPLPQVVTFVGVGVYEEVLFRLLGCALLARLLNLMFVPWIVAFPIAAVASAAGFAAAHHFVASDPFVPLVFFTRTLIGVYLALVFWLRGLGVAVGAHIVYNLVVGLQHD
jgi:hypothetical protein